MRIPHFYVPKIFTLEINKWINYTVEILPQHLRNYKITNKKRLYEKEIVQLWKSDENKENQIFDTKKNKIEKF